MNLPFGQPGHTLIRCAIDRINSFYSRCRHSQQNIAGWRLGTGGHEMYLMCAVCQKRLSPGVVVGQTPSLSGPEEHNDFFPLASGAD